jgi:hypothetical protein
MTVFRTKPVEDVLAQQEDSGDGTTLRRSLGA